jgi:hypothetical protein
MASSIDDLTAMAMMRDGGADEDVTLEDVISAMNAKVEQKPSWIQAELSDFCDAVGISVSTLKLFITTVERAHHPSSIVLNLHIGSETDQPYLHALWCQAEGFELLDLKEKVHILPTTMVELLRMHEHLIETGQSRRHVKKVILSEYGKFHHMIHVKQLANFIRKRSMEAFMDSI